MLGEGHADPGRDIAAAEQGGDRGVEVWGLDRTGQVSTLYQVTPGGAWSSWEGPGFKGQPIGFLRLAASGQNNGNVMLLAASRDGKLRYVGQQWPGGDWGPWASIDGPPSGMRASWPEPLAAQPKPSTGQVRTEPPQPQPQPPRPERPIIAATLEDQVDIRKEPSPQVFREASSPPCGGSSGARQVDWRSRASKKGRLAAALSEDRCSKKNPPPSP